MTFSSCSPCSSRPCCTNLEFPGERRAERLVGFALIGMVDAVGGAALAALAGLPPSGAWPSSPPPRSCTWHITCR